MRKSGYIGAAAILVLILFLGGLIINSVLNSEGRLYAENKSAISKDAMDVMGAEETVEQDTEAPEQEDKTASDVSKNPEIIKYTVVEGDTLEAVASRYNVSVNTVAISSGISADSILKIGQELQFPSINGILYKVKGGETLWDISNTYDVDVSDIVSDNGLESPDKLKIDQEIILAGVTSLKETKTAAKTAAQNESKAASQSSANVKLASRGTASAAIKGLWPVRGSISSGFGTRWGKLHKGIDIAAPTGTDVHAFMAGTVTFSGWDNGGYGYLVIIKHSNGLSTYYGHNSKLLVKSGQNVDAGQHIADVGSTGDSTGPHCHFEIRKNGTPVNPIPYLK